MGAGEEGMSHFKKEVVFIGHDLPEPYLHVNLLSRSSHYYLEEHSHKMYQLIWVIQGILQLNYRGTDYQLSRGQLCIIPPYHMHALTSETGYTQLGVDLNPSSDARGIIAIMEKQVKEFVVLDRSDLLAIIPILEEKNSQLTLLSKLQTAHLLDSLLISSLDMLGSEASFRERLLMLMEVHLTERLSIDVLAHRLNLSPSTLKRTTHREFGCSVTELYHQLRLRKACSLLVNSDMLLEEIANTLGFYDQSHFSRFFKDKMKLSPAQYRRKELT